MTALLCILSAVVTVAGLAMMRVAEAWFDKCWRSARRPTLGIVLWAGGAFVFVLGVLSFAATLAGGLR